MFGWLKNYSNLSWQKAKYETEAVFAIKRLSGFDVQKDLGSTKVNHILGDIFSTLSHVSNFSKEDFAFLAFIQFAKHYPEANSVNIAACAIVYAYSVRPLLSPASLEFLEELEVALLDSQSDASDLGEDFAEGEVGEIDVKEIFDREITDPNKKEIVDIANHSGSQTNEAEKQQSLHRSKESHTERVSLDLSGLVDNEDYLGIRDIYDNHKHLNFQDDQGWTLLHWAAFSSKQELAAWLLKVGANIHARSRNGITPLHVSNDRGLTETLLESGADPNARTLFGSTPLHHAASLCWDDGSCIEALIEAGADIMARCPNGIVFESLSFLGDFDGVPKAIDDAFKEWYYPKCFGYGSPNLAVWSGSTPLHWASISMNSSGSSILGKLLELGSPVMDQDEAGNSPIHWASYNGKTEQIDFLVAQGACVGHTNSAEALPIHLSAATHRAENVSCLIKLKSDVTATDIHGRTPLHYAVDPENRNHDWAEDRAYDTIKHILAAGGDVNAKDSNGESPWNLANRNDNLMKSNSFCLLSQRSFL
jgi:ankyrin repeat protein